jgi:hypothetical protein
MIPLQRHGRMMGPHSSSSSHEGRKEEDGIIEDGEDEVEIEVEEEDEEDEEKEVAEEEKDKES